MCSSDLESEIVREIVEKEAFGISSMPAQINLVAGGNASAVVHFGLRQIFSSPQWPAKIAAARPGVLRLRPGWRCSEKPALW